MAAHPSLPTILRLSDPLLPTAAGLYRLLGQDENELVIHTAVSLPALTNELAHAPPTICLLPADQIQPDWPTRFPHTQFIGLLMPDTPLHHPVAGIHYLVSPPTAVQLRPFLASAHLHRLNQKYQRQRNDQEKVEAYLSLYQTAFDTSYNIIVVLDPQAYIIAANKTFWTDYAHLGLDVDHATQQLTCAQPDERLQWEALLRKAFTGESFKQEFRLNGHTLALAINPITAPIDGVTAVAIFAHDITNRERIKQDLQESNQKLQAYVEELAALNNIARTVAQETDLQAALEVVAELMTKLFRARNTGITLLDETAQTLTVVADYSSHPGEPSPRGLVMPLQGNRSSWLVVKEARTIIVQDPQNSDLTESLHNLMRQRRTTSLMIAPLLARGTVIGTIAVDTTDPQRTFTAEETTLLETVAVQIANTIENARLFDEERRMRQQAERQNKDLDSFASTVAHDLKSPMSIVMGFAEMLRESGATMPADEIEMMAEQIFLGGRKMISIVEELLVLSSVTREEVKLMPLEMSAVLDQALQRLAGLRQSYEGEIIMPPHWPTCLGHAIWVEEVWVNYLSNAIKYGGQPYRIELGYDPEPDGQIRFWVQDNGAGIPPSQKDEIFVEFTRLDQAKAQGHGLGLSIVKRIIEKLGGTVGVICTDPESPHPSTASGCRFYFTLTAGQSS